MMGSEPKWSLQVCTPSKPGMVLKRSPENYNVTTLEPFKMLLWPCRMGELSAVH